MNAVEEIQAAIDRLSRLKFSSSVRPWLAEPYLYGDDGDFSRVRITSADDDDDHNTAEGVLRVDAELIVVLHATVDAQIALLNQGLRFAQITPNLMTDSALDLARAINGATS